MGSKNALAASPGAAAYCTAKASEIHLARCLALECAPFGIRVNVVNPDAVLRGSRIWQGEWAEQRVLFGQPLSKMQVTQFKFVEMLTQLTAARELIYACIRERNRGVDATQTITMAKIFCARVARYVADECIQLSGGYGYMKESHAGRAFVDSRLISIGGGSDETMIHYLAKQLGF